MVLMTIEEAFQEQGKCIGFLSDQLLDMEIKMIEMKLEMKLEIVDMKKMLLANGSIIVDTKLKRIKSINKNTAQMLIDEGKAKLVAGNKI